MTQYVKKKILSDVGNFPATQTVSGSVNVDNQISGFATQTTLAQIDAKISTGSGDVPGGTDIQRVLTYGANGGGQKVPINIDSQGHLKITQQDREIQRESVKITTDFSGGGLSGNIGVGTKTAYWDSQNYDKFQTIVSGTNGSFGEMTLESSNTTIDGDFVPFLTEYEQGNGPYYFKFTNPDAYQRYWRLVNTSGALITFSVIEVSFLK